MPWMDCICRVWIVCYRLVRLKVVLCHCRGVHASDGKVTRGLPSPTLVKVFIPWEVAIYLLFYYFNAMKGRDGLSFGYLLSKFSKVVLFAPYKRTLSSVQFKIIIMIIMIRCSKKGTTD